MRRAVAAAALVAATLPVSAEAAPRFAYVSLPPENSHKPSVLVAVDADGTHRSRLLTAAGIASPVWSPDGRTIAVETCAAGTYTCKGPALQLVNSVTGARHRLLRGGFEPVGWSPNGTELLVERVAQPGSDTYNLSLVDLRGHHRFVDSSVVEASWSPDGRKIVYQVGANGLSGDIAVFDIRSGRSRRLTHDGYATSPVWSPDGREIAYVDGSRGDQVALVRPDGRGWRIVDDPAADDGNPHWLSARLIGYTRTVSGPNGKPKGSSLATYDLVRRRRRIIASDPGSVDWCAGRGGAAVYTTGDTTYNFGPRKVWLLPVTARTPLRLTSGGYGDEPQAAPDCSAVALTDNVGDPLITTLTIHGTHVRQHRIGVGRFVTWRPTR